MSKSQCLPHIMAAKQMVQIWIGEITSLPRYVCSERDMSGGMGERQANRRSRVEDVYRRVSLPLAVCLTTWTEKLQTTIPVCLCRPSYMAPQRALTALMMPLVYHLRKTGQTDGRIDTRPLRVHF